MAGSQQIKAWGKLGKMCRKSCETIIGSDQEFAMIVIIGEKKAFSASISDHSKATKCSVGKTKSSRKYSWTFFSHSNHFISLNVQEKAQKADGIKKLMNKLVFFSGNFQPF